MSPERRTSTPFTLFPIGESALKDGTIWLQKNTHSPDMLDTERNKLKNRDPAMYLYAFNMGFLRRLVQFDDSTSTENAYWNGAFYMLSTLESQYESLWKEQPAPSQDVMKTHFFNLVDVESNHGALLACSPEIFEDKPFHDMMTGFLDGYRTKNFDALVKNFAINSKYNVHKVFEENPELERCLTRGSLQQTHGPALGLVYGAFDIYELFRIYEDGKMWEKKLEIMVK